MGLWLIHAQALHEPAVLLGCQASRLTFFSRPLETAGFQALVEQHETVALPVQRLDPVPAPTAEQKQCIGEGVQVKLLLDQCCQAVDAPAKVGVAAGDVHLVGTIEVAQHDFRIRSTVSTVAISAPVWISASAPAIRTVTATPPERTDCTGVTSANRDSC